MKQHICKIVFLFLTLSLLFTSITPLASAVTKEILNTGLKGKTISILGDSISTYAGVSNNTDVNPTLKDSALYYFPGTLGVYQDDTWWQKTAESLGMRVLVNNSWSGSHAYLPSAGTAGAYVDRCVQLHNIQGEEPDIIALYLGTNDFGTSLYS